MCWAVRTKQAGHPSNYLFYLHNFLECQKYEEESLADNAFFLLE